MIHSKTYKEAWYIIETLLGDGKFTADFEGNLYDVVEWGEKKDNDTLIYSDKVDSNCKDLEQLIKSRLESIKEWREKKMLENNAPIDSTMEVLATALDNCTGIKRSTDIMSQWEKEFRLECLKLAVGRGCSATEVADEYYNWINNG